MFCSLNPGFGVQETAAKTLEPFVREDVVVKSYATKGVICKKAANLRLLRITPARGMIPIQAMKNHMGHVASDKPARRIRWLHAKKQKEKQYEEDKLCRRLQQNLSVR
ncbi:hypothetical protein GTO91_12065 [Heliobacterium undosum]|uniref:Uncharacterized protein n=1 Tax=Heliomicrobium undosum TaxID=121734 RepID=A0A845L9R5_9FIRM|nr:hypothetical protein [Heliomicrobium undosum]MZP30448.1 hypothetical protein [Heliomicrobium undosum]